MNGLCEDLHNIILIGFNIKSMHKMLQWCVNIFAVGVLESPFKHALVCLSLFFLCLYMSVKKLAICCWTSLY